MAKESDFVSLKQVNLIYKKERLKSISYQYGEQICRPSVTTKYIDFKTNKRSMGKETEKLFQALPTKTYKF